MTSKQRAPALDCAGRLLDLSRPRVMGVINITPDSFSDGGTLYHREQPDLELALRRAADMVDSGAAILDIGGESTRPGATPVSEAEEMDRVLPLVERISAELDVVISVDTSCPGVMRESAARGAGIINDVRALRREGALEAAAASGMLPDLRGLCVVIVGARVDTESAQRVKKFWIDYFEATGATLNGENYMHRPVSVPSGPCPGIQE